MDRLVIVIFVPVFVEAQQSILQDLVDGRLPSAGGAHAHEPMSHQLSLVQLDHLANLRAYTTYDMYVRHMYVHIIYVCIYVACGDIQRTARMYIYMYVCSIYTHMGFNYWMQQS